jgi:spore coat protein U-like protein
MSSTKEITHTVPGQLSNSAANQDAPAGAYSDTITVTVVY